MRKLAPVATLLAILRHISRRIQLPRTAVECGAPGVTRTPDTRFRKPLLYPPELRGQSQTYADETGRCESIWSNDRPFIG